MMETAFARHTGVQVPLICGPMYPCSNPELVAAVSDAGGLGIIQPISLTYVHGYEYRAGLRYLKSLTPKPIGFNALIEGNNKIYLDRMRMWIDIALEEGVRFFLTSLGNPKWVCERVHAAGGVVYHDVTDRRWAEKALEHQVDGLIAVNRRAGGHAGKLSAEELLHELGGLNLPVVAAGGIGDERGFVAALELGYAGVQMGTRFIATPECRAHDDYKRAVNRYANATEVVWVQEEPQNQGAWYRLRAYLRADLDASKVLAYAGRPISASPAVGYAAKHAAEQKQVVADAFQHRGLGRLLTQKCIDIGRRWGLKQITGETTTDNLAMTRIFRSLGFHVESRHEHQAVLARLDLRS